MNFAPIVQRLQDFGMPRVNRVGAFALIAAEPVNHLPATFVVPGEERVEPRRKIAGKYDQRINCDFLVYLIVGAERANADAIDRDYDRYSALAVDALTGWVHPDAEGRATEYQGAELLSLKQRELGWGIAFRTFRRITRTETD
jgi:hypothetical protein